MFEIPVQVTTLKMVIMNGLMEIDEAGDRSGFCCTCGKFRYEEDDEWRGSGHYYMPEVDDEDGRDYHRYDRDEGSRAASCGVCWDDLITMETLCYRYDDWGEEYE